MRTVTSYEKRYKNKFADPSPAAVPSPIVFQFSFLCVIVDNESKRETKDGKHESN